MKYFFNYLIQGKINRIIAADTAQKNHKPFTYKIPEEYNNTDTDDCNLSNTSCSTERGSEKATEECDEINNISEHLKKDQEITYITNDQYEGTNDDNLSDASDATKCGAEKPIEECDKINNKENIHCVKQHNSTTNIKKTNSTKNIVKQKTLKNKIEQKEPIVEDKKTETLGYYFFYNILLNEKPLAMLSSKHSNKKSKTKQLDKYVFNMLLGNKYSKDDNKESTSAKLSKNSNNKNSSFPNKQT